MCCEAPLRLCVKKKQSLQKDFARLNLFSEKQIFFLTEKEGLVENIFHTVAPTSSRDQTTDAH